MQASGTLSPQNRHTWLKKREMEGGGLFGKAQNWENSLAKY